MNKELKNKILEFVKITNKVDESDIYSHPEKYPFTPEEFTDYVDSIIYEKMDGMIGLFHARNPIYCDFPTYFIPIRYKSQILILAYIRCPPCDVKILFTKKGLKKTETERMAKIKEFDARCDGMTGEEFHAEIEKESLLPNNIFEPI